MPTKRKFSARFPTARIKKIMQLDDEIGKLSATVPPVVSRALELFVEQLLTKAYKLTISRNSKTILPSYLKEVIDNEDVFAFLKPIVAHVAPAKSLEESKTRINAVVSEGKSKQKNGSSGRKRQIDECLSDCILSDESGPSNSSKSNGRRKCLRLKNQGITQSESSVDLCTVELGHLGTECGMKNSIRLCISQSQILRALSLTTPTPFHFPACLAPYFMHADACSMGTFYLHC
ncbi:dr1 associated corepressor [Echinococcus multilocularis]|uniref:Dr1 associated corepressor n=1 Tax=Echinococcus multilocularis TaxID=6211 RepID=A0A087VYU2_ECHMU|nr:dr1 associated corepressor [Echinococcus multilocularis]